MSRAQTHRKHEDLLTGDDPELREHSWNSWLEKRPTHSSRVYPSAQGAALELTHGRENFTAFPAFPSYTQQNSKETLHSVPCLPLIFPALWTPALLAAQKNPSYKGKFCPAQPNPRRSLTHLPWKGKTSLSGWHRLYPSQPASF